MVLTLQKVWSFVRHHWYVPIALIVALIIYITTKDKGSVVSLGKALKDASDAHSAEIDALERAAVDRKTADNRAIRRMEDVRRQVMEEFDRNERILDARQKRRVEQITKRLKDDPYAMALEIESETGVRVVVIE